MSLSSRSVLALVRLPVLRLCTYILLLPYTSRQWTLLHPTDLTSHITASGNCVPWPSCQVKLPTVYTLVIVELSLPVTLTGAHSRKCVSVTCCLFLLELEVLRVGIWLLLLTKIMSALLRGWCMVSAQWGHDDLLNGDPWSYSIEYGVRNFWEGRFVPGRHGIFWIASET